MSTKADYYNSLGIRLANSGQLTEAIEYFQLAISANPGLANAYYNLGLAFKETGHLDESIKNYLQAVEYGPSSATYLVNLGVAYFEIGKYELALKAYQKALNLDPQNSAIYNNIGNACLTLKKPKLAIKYLSLAHKAEPENIIYCNNLGNAYLEGGDLVKAYKLLSQAVKLDVKVQYAEPRAPLIYVQKKLSLWKDLQKTSQELDQLIAKTDQPIESAFNNILRSDDEAQNLKIAKAVSDNLLKQIQKNVKSHYKKTRGPKLKIGYISNGFRDFPTGQNIVGVLENHNKQLFEIFAFSHGINDRSAWQKRISSAVDHFIDIRKLSDLSAAKLINRLGIDVLVDLKGHTHDSRLKIFAYRPAPIQVAYLGFPGTTGAAFIDYLIADRVVLPPSSQKYYSEKVIYLPHSYRPTDNKLKIPSLKFSRQDFGLPQDKFVFASFNTPYKIEPDMFDAWARILHQVPDSVLWLYSPHPVITRTLLDEAAARGLPKDKIIVAAKMPKANHLARIGLANLVLDTHIVNGHTTTVDCLWAGVPVITILGHHFASRVSASALTAAGLPQLIAKNKKEYEELAVDLATHPPKLAAIRKSLILNRKSRPLFDTKSYTRNLEQAFLSLA